MNRDGRGGDSHERHESYAWHEPTGKHTHNDTQSHAGNGTVNDGPDEQSLDGLGSDELDLRSMLHQAVQSVEPRDGTLEHLRRAVPARRARKRQAAVGMAAAALFIGTAVPALVHVSNSTGSDVNPSVAGQASQAHGGAGQGKNPDDAHSSADDDPGKSPDKGKTGDGGGGKTKGTGSGSGSSAGADPAATGPADAPVCTSVQLDATTDAATAPDSMGTVYGGFRVVNVSAAACTVDGPGSVGASALGAADPARIGTARHAAGDAATGLPDPSTEAAALVLQPSAAYAVKFAWVPSETCPSNGSTGGDTGAPSADPSPSQDAGTTSGATTGTNSGVTTQLLTADGTADGSVVVTHTAQAGAPSVSATVTGACAGTVYYTGLLAGS